MLPNRPGPSLSGAEPLMRVSIGCSNPLRRRGSQSNCEQADLSLAVDYEHCCNRIQVALDCGSRTQERQSRKPIAKQNSKIPNPVMTTRSLAR